MSDSRPIQDRSARRVRLGTFVLLLGTAWLAVLGLAEWQHLDGHESMRDALRLWRYHEAYDDSWGPMRTAYAWYAAPHRGLLYQTLFFHDHVKFQYPPSSLLIFALPDAVGVAPGDDQLNAVGWVAVLLEALATGAIAWSALVRAQGARAHGDRRGRAMLPAAALLVAAAALTFHPVLHGYQLGQVQTWLNALFAFSTLALLGGRETLAGCLVGAVCLVKPQFGLFLPWALIRRRYRFAAGMVGVFGIGIAASLALFGWADHVDYLAALSFLSRHGEAFYANQSLNGLVQRFLGNGEAVVWHANDFPPYRPVVYGLSLVAGLALTAFGLLWRRCGDAASFCVAALTCTMASPIAWEHHYGILPPILALLAVASVVSADRRFHRAAIAALALAFIAASSFFPPATGSTLAGWSGLWASYLFYAGLVVLALVVYHAEAIAALGIDPRRSAAHHGAAVASITHA